MEKDGSKVRRYGSRKENLCHINRQQLFYVELSLLVAGAVYCDPVRGEWHVLVDNCALASRRRGQAQLRLRKTMA